MVRSHLQRLSIVSTNSYVEMAFIQSAIVSEFGWCMRYNFGVNITFFNQTISKNCLIYNSQATQSSIFYLWMQTQFTKYTPCHVDGLFIAVCKYVSSTILEAMRDDNPGVGCLCLHWQQNFCKTPFQSYLSSRPRAEADDAKIYFTLYTVNSLSGLLSNNSHPIISLFDQNLNSA